MTAGATFAAVGAAPEPPAGHRPAPRIAIVVLGCVLPVYQRCVQAIRATWGAVSRPEIDIFYLYGAQGAEGGPEQGELTSVIGQAVPELADGESLVIDDILLAGAGDRIADQSDCVLRKRLIAFGQLADQGRYDFVYSVCATSYVDADALARYIAGLPTRGVYHGPLALCGHSGHPFVSGASMLLSTDLVADLAANRAEIVAANAGTLADDVAIGRWIAEHHADESAAGMRRRIAAGEPATASELFVLPNGRGMVSWVHSPTIEHVPQPDAFHYHFHSQRIDEMEAFHGRYFDAGTRQ